MKGRIVILGGAGRLGRAAAQAFRAAEWQVASLVRGSSAEGAASGTEIIEVDARDAESVVAAASGADVVLHALNLPYTEWARLALPFADTAIAAARANGATLVFPGNLYNYGADMPARIDETAPMHPTSRKGAVRAAIETRMREAADGGLRTIVLRAGDYFGGEGRGSWFDRIVVREIAAGRLTYPGPLDVVHEWAYLPDFAQALVQLVERRRQLAPFATFGFPGHAVTGREFVAAISRVCRREFKVDFMPWRLLKLMSVVVPVFRELADISYLWSTPHAIDGARLAQVIGDVPRTPLDRAIAASLAALGVKRRSSV
ncbi:MAG TPA: NAD-dependent epimerase/dehydratase family protein [Xanthobacteraceae bacterium]|jgi:nucleoside-diphosphate-sugar epimerase|nr:NAD-dependent epimerase/dehydratase family protein [Xanthobacteraceae bacterium]